VSETTKTAETMKRAADQTTRSSQAAVDAAGKATKDVFQESSQAAQAGADRAREAGHRMTETVAETAGATADLSTRTAEQSREALFMGVRTAADVGHRVADISFGRGHRWLTSATQAMDIYRDASDRSAECMQALFSSYLTFGRGLQAIQHAWLESADHAIETATHKPQDLLRCKNVIELAEVQRDLYIDVLNHAVESTTRLFDIAGRTAQDTVRSLQPRAH
jgi:Phasin protein